MTLGSQLSNNEGVFETNPAIQIMINLFDQRASGSLVAQHQESKKALYFKDGAPIGAKSNNPNETLVRLAKRFNVIDDSTFEKVVSAINSGNDQPQQQLLLAAGVSPNQVSTLLKRQTAIRCADLCTWQKGRYRFKSELPDEIPGEATDPFSVIAEYLKLKFKPDVFRQNASALAAKAPVCDESRLARYQNYLTTNPEVSEVLGKIRGANGKPAGAILGDPNSNPNALKWWLSTYTLLELKIIDFTTATNETSIPRRSPAQGAAAAQSATTTKPQPAPPKALNVKTASIANQQRSDDRQTNPELEKKYQQMRNQNLFEILGLQPTADAKAVKKAYFALAKQYHPDKYFDPETKRPNKSAEQVFSLINQAYEELRDDAKRAAYVELIQRGTTADAEVKKAEAILTSEIEFQKAQILIKRKKWSEALGHLKTAIELHAEEPEYKVQLNWVKFMVGFPNNKNQYESALVDMRNLLNAGGRAANAESWYLYGRMLKIADNKPAAIQAFKKVLELDRKHKEAPRELRVLEGDSPSSKLSK